MDFVAGKITFQGAAFFVGLALLVGCATPQKPDFYPKPGAPHTMTFTDKSGKEVVVYDLRGKWETEYSGQREVIAIEQTGNQFRGYKTIGNVYVTAGQLTISGKIEGNLVDCGTHWSGGDITSLVSKISRDGTEFECGGSHRKTLKRIK